MSDTFLIDINQNVLIVRNNNLQSNPINSDVVGDGNIESVTDPSSQQRSNLNQIPNQPIPPTVVGQQDQQLPLLNIENDTKVSSRVDM